MDPQDMIDANLKTKKALLEFLQDEKRKHEKSKSKLLKLFKENQNISENCLKGLLIKLNSNILELDNYFSKILEAQKISKLENDPELRLLNLDPEEAIEKIKLKVPENSYSDIKMFCGISVEIEKMIESLVELKLEDMKNLIAELRNDFEKEKSNKITNDMSNFHHNKKSSNSFWYFIINIMIFLVSLYTSIYYYSNPLTHLQETSTNSTNIDFSKIHSPLYKNSNLNLSEPGNDQRKEIKNWETYRSVVDTDTLIVCSLSERDIISIDLKTFKAKNLNLSHCYGQYSNAFIYDNNSILFYGEFMHENLLVNAFILDADLKIKKLIWGEELRFPSLTYYDNYVYAFSGRVSAKYNYLQDKWENCAQLWGERNSDVYSSVGFENHILIVNNWNELQIYDIKENEFKYRFQYEEKLRLGEGKKLIFSANNRVYIIEFPGKIYQSATYDFTKWEIIATKNIKCDENLLSYVVRFNEKFYFQCIKHYKSELLELDLNKRSFKYIPINI